MPVLQKREQYCVDQHEPGLNVVKLDRNDAKMRQHMAGVDWRPAGGTLAALQSQRPPARLTDMPMKGLMYVAASCAALMAAIVAAAYFGQRRLMYFPDRARTQPAAIGLPSVTEHEIYAPDGHFVVSWWGRARAGKPTLLYFHGNAQSLAARQPRIERALTEGWGILMMTYRGFGGSTGTPSEADNVADAFRTFDFLEAQGIPRRDIILYGESLGTGVATQVAAKRAGIRGMILDAPYTSTVEVGQQRYPFLPVAWGMLDRYETRRFIADVRAPLLILHGALDQVVPVEMGRELMRLANEPKTYVEFPRGGHMDLYVNGNDALTATKAWIAALEH